MRLRSILPFFALTLLATAAEDDLPTKGGKAPQETSGLLPEAGDPLFPNTKLSDAAFLQSIDPPNVEKAKTTLEQAQRKEQRWQRLGKSGVLAQVEVEKATIATARARTRYERARVALQEAELKDLQARKAAADTIAAAEAALLTARTMAAEAEAAMNRTELLIAESNVDRQRRLLKLGAGSRSALQRAESTLAQLRGAPANR